MKLKYGNLVVVHEDYAKFILLTNIESTIELKSLTNISATFYQRFFSHTFLLYCVVRTIQHPESNICWKIVGIGGSCRS